MTSDISLFVYDRYLRDPTDKDNNNLDVEVTELTNRRYSATSAGYVRGSTPDNDIIVAHPYPDSKELNRSNNS